MSLHVYLRWLRDHGGGAAVLGLGLVGVVSMYLALWPSMSGGGNYQELLESMPEGYMRAFNMQDLTSIEGYAQSTVFGLIAFVTITFSSIGAGARAIAGDEEAGRLEFVLSRAVSRGSVLVARALAVASTTLLLVVVTAGTALVVAADFDLPLRVSGMVAVSAALLGAALFHGMLALGVGAVTGRRSVAMAAGAGVLVLGYVLNGVGGEWAAWVPDLSPYHWAFDNAPLRNGPSWPGLAALYGGAGLFVVIGWLVFRRRDVHA